MDYRDTWNLATIPDEVLRSEWAKRCNSRRLTKGGGRAPSCECGKCPKCKMRLYQQRRREAKTTQGD